MGISNDVNDSDRLYELAVSGFGKKPAPTPGQFRTWLAKIKNVDVSYSKAQTAVERLKRVRARDIDSVVVGAPKTKSSKKAVSDKPVVKHEAARHTRSHGTSK